MIQRILNSKNFVACLLAAATGMVLYFKMPFPEENLFFELMFLWARPVFHGIQVLLHRFPVHDPLHRLLGFAVRSVHFRAQVPQTH